MAVGNDEVEAESPKTPVGISSEDEEEDETKPEVEADSWGGSCFSRSTSVCAPVKR